LNILNDICTLDGHWMQKLERLPLLKVFFLLLIPALAVRILALFFLQDGCFLKESICLPIGDQLEFLGLAENLSLGKGFVYESAYSLAGKPYAYRGPGYPIFIVLFSFLTGGKLFLLRLLQLFLSAFIPFMLFQFASCFLPRSWAFITGVICSISPFFFYHSLFFLADFLYHLLFLLGFTCLFLAFKRNDHKKKIFLASLAGLSMALAALTRTEAFYLNFVILPFLFLFFWKGKISINQILIYFFIFSIPVGGWIFRNYYHFGTYLGLQSRILGLNLYFHYQEKYSGIPWQEFDEWAPGAIKKYYSADNEAEADQVLKREFVEFIKKHPETFLKVTFLKFFKVWKLFPLKKTGVGQTVYQGSIYPLVSFFVYVLFIPFAFVGVYFLFKEYPLEGLFLLAIFLAMTTMAALASSGMRHRIILMPFFYLSVTIALQKIWQGISSVGK